MEHIEIDNLEVSDSVVEITYWNSGYNEPQTVMFKTKDFQDWLLDQRDVSIGAYWDQWDPKVSDGLGYQIVLDDMEQYLCFRFDSLKSGASKVHAAYADKKPMTRVSADEAGADLRSQS